MTHPHTDPLISQLVALIQEHPFNPVEREQLQQKVLQKTQSWAAGLWKVDTSSLKQILFTTSDGFDPHVAEEFQQATREVSLEQTQLGIVNAVVHRRPALAISTEQTGDLRKSATWLERFGARCSLSCPVHDRSGAIVAVWAVAWQNLLNLESPPAQDLLEMSALLGQQLGPENT